jgi:hypothetical protein
MSNSAQQTGDENCGRSVEDFARRMKISKAMAYRVINRGEIPVLRFGKRIIVPERVINDLLAGAMPLPKMEAAARAAPATKLQVERPKQAAKRRSGAANPTTTA